MSSSVLVGVVGFEPTTLRHQVNKINHLRDSKQVRRGCGTHFADRVEIFSRGERPLPYSANPGRWASVPAHARSQPRPPRGYHPTAKSALAGRGRLVCTTTKEWRFSSRSELVKYAFPGYQRAVSRDRRGVPSASPLLLYPSVRGFFRRHLLSVPVAALAITVVVHNGVGLYIACR